MSSLYTKIKKNFVKAFVRHSTPRAGRKAGSMNMLRRFASFGGTRSRAYGAGLTAILMAATLSLLVACGGGGGGGTTPPPAATASLTGTQVSVPIPLDTSSGKGSVTWTSAHTSGTVKVYLGTTEIGSGASGTISDIAFAPGDNTIAVKNGDGTTLKTLTVAGTCDSRATLTGGACVFNSLAPYSDVVMASTGALPLRIIRNGNGTFAVERTKNLTSHTDGAYPLTHCAHHIDENFFTDGRKLQNCRDIANVWHNLYLDPVGNALYDYNGPAPARAIPDDPNWIEVQSPLGSWGNHTQITAGWYYTLDDTGVLLFDNNGVGGAVTVFSEDSAKLEGSIRSLVTHSHP